MPFLAILMRSPSAEMAPCAQHEPAVLRNMLVEQAKILDIEQSIAERAVQLRTIVDEVRVQRFRFYWSAVKAQRAVLHYLFTVSKVDGLPPIARHYVRETAFIHPGPNAR